MAVILTNLEPLWFDGLKSIGYPPTLKFCIESKAS